MSYTEETRRKAREIRQRLRKPPNAVRDQGIDTTKKSSGIKGYEVPFHKELPPLPIQAPPRVAEGVERPLTFATVLSSVASHHGISVEDMKGPVRNRKVAIPRRIASYLGHKLLPNRSISSLARELHKDHTTVLYACSEMKKNLTINSVLHDHVSYLEEAILAGNNN